MPTLSTLVVKLVGDTAGFKSDIGEAEKTTSGFASTMENVGGKVSRIGGVMQGALSWVGGNVIMRGIDAITGSFGSLADGMINGNAQFERYQVQFGVLLGSADAAKQRLDELAKFGASTPFELPQVVEADKILQGFGLHSAEAAEKFGFSGEQIRTIAGDVASGTGADFSEMSLLIGKFSSGATGEAISRMQEMGITTREELTKMGLEFSKSGQLTSPLPQAMNTVLTIMQKKYGGMMDAQSHTFEGMMSNLNDFVGQTLRTIGQPIFELLKDKLGTLLSFLGSPVVQGAISGFATFLADGIGKAIGIVTNLIGNFQDAFGEAGLAGGIAGFVERLGTMLGVSTETMTQVGIVIQQAIEGAQSTFEGIVAWVQANWPTIQTIIGQVINAVVAFVNDPLMPILGFAIEMFGKVVAWVQENWPTISSIIETVISKVKAVIDDPLTPILKFVIKVFGQVLAWVQENWPLISSVVGNILNAIKNIVQTVLPIVRTVFSTIFGALMPIVEGALTLVLGVVRGILQLINGDTSGALETFRQTFETVFNGVVEFVRSLPQKFIDFGRSLIDGLVKGVNDKIEEFKAALFAWLPDWAKQALGITSPSKVFAYYGEMSALGYIQGFASTLNAETMSRLVPGAGMGMGASRFAGAPALATSGQGGAGAALVGGVAVHFHGNVTVRSDADIDLIARQVAERIRRGS